MRIFVTGGAGYVGSHAVRRLISVGHDVTVFDNLAFGHRQAVHPSAAFVQGDLADGVRLCELLKEGAYDAVMHFAAWLNVGESVHKPLMYYRNNVANTLNLLEAMEQTGVRRMVFSSTCAVYGEPDTLPLVEDLPKAPINPYGATKLAVEFMLKDSATAWGLGSVALRYFNASGAAADGTIGEDHDPECHLIPLVLQVALGQRPHLSVFGTDYPTPDGSCVRDYVHVDDLAEVHLLAIEGAQPGRAEAYNVGTGTGTSVLEVIDSARRATGHSIPVQMAPRRAGDPPSLYANSDNVRRRFGWSPRHVGIDTIVASAWSWHRAHPHGFADRKKK
jgi:UDP-glucose 4-epimerase